SSATTLTDVATLIPKYGTTTSDHYPMFTQFSFTPPIALPVTLLDFTAVRQDATAKLAWTTTSENNSASFQIERSGDNKTFTAIGTVAAQGNTSSTTRYSFIDEAPLSGNNYYRLKQIDIDGKSTYSRIVVLSFGTITLRITPNPAHGTATLSVGNTSQAYSITVLNLGGQTVRQYMTTPGTTNIPMDLGGLSKGVYTIKVVSPTSVVTQKLLVQ
ncbi:MAG: T9SS type A sorting domain-containing protein, partial [Bacteroidetes bacterium]|nr:T9SS type A sorting domain-containing protein [Bacteroidota bacterium]